MKAYNKEYPYVYILITNAFPQKLTKKHKVHPSSDLTQPTALQHQHAL